jgi:hypothetical protein
MPFWGKTEGNARMRGKIPVDLCLEIIMAIEQDQVNVPKTGQVEICQGVTA